MLRICMCSLIGQMMYNSFDAGEIPNDETKGGGTMWAKRIRAGLKLVGYAGVTVIALGAGEFAFCIAYGFLLLEALLHVAEMLRTKGDEISEQDPRGVLPNEDNPALPRAQKRLDKNERSANAE